MEIKKKFSHEKERKEVVLMKKKSVVYKNKFSE